MRLDDSVRGTVDEIENVFIPLADGCRIAARLWVPKGAACAPVPAILEFIPYRKRDFMRSRDESIHRYVAAHGYAVIRADVRGTGDSDGILQDEYTVREQLDACEIIAWIATQPWCTGAVGMFGISWGGFNALQVAARRPPALKAIMTLCASDDRYADDAHYMGGCLLNENMQWGSVLMVEAALPPDPAIVGSRWRDMWRQRVAAVVPFPVVWMRHPARDAYWRQGSVCEDYAAIQCPVYAIGGWADGYSNAVPRLVANLRAPCKGLVGPWPHAFPHDAAPGPSIGFLQEAVRWWDQWLKGRDTGIMGEPRYRVWMQEPVVPSPLVRCRDGRWVAEPEWPSAAIEWQAWFLGCDRLSRTAAAPGVRSLSSPQTVGLCAGDWCGFGADGDLPRDQRLETGGSLVFDSAPLAERIELLGAPVLELEARVDQPRAVLCARLCDVAPDGTTSRISYGLLNLARPDGRPAAASTPRGWIPLRIQLNDLASAVPAGHRLRLALSTSYWPIAWPSPRPATLTVRTGIGRLSLPVRAPRPDDASLRPFERPEAAPADAGGQAGGAPATRTVTIDLANDELVSTLDAGREGAGPRLAHLPTIGVALGRDYRRRYRIRASDPLSASTEIDQSAVLQRDDWRIRLTCSTRLTATPDAFRFTGTLRAFEGDAEFAVRHWALDVPRADG